MVILELLSHVIVASGGSFLKRGNAAVKRCKKTYFRWQIGRWYIGAATMWLLASALQLPCEYPMSDWFSWQFCNPGNAATIHSIQAGAAVADPYLAIMYWCSFEAAMLIPGYAVTVKWKDFRKAVSFLGRTAKERRASDRQNTLRRVTMYF